MPKFNDIPRFPRASYTVDVPWDHLENHLASWDDPKGKLEAARKRLDDMLVQSDDGARMLDTAAGRLLLAAPVLGWQRDALAAALPLAEARRLFTDLEVAIQLVELPPTERDAARRLGLKPPGGNQ